MFSRRCFSSFLCPSHFRKTQDSLTCHICGEIGHKRRDCPKKTKLKRYLNQYSFLYIATFVLFRFIKFSNLKGGVYPRGPLKEGGVYFESNLWHCVALCGIVSKTIAAQLRAEKSPMTGFPYLFALRKITEPRIMDHVTADLPFSWLS